MSETIQGVCLLMCPEKERWIREREGLLHRFEIDENTKEMKFPKADPMKTIKCFSRPAAGLNMTDPHQLRPASVLLSTVRYLFTRIATRSDVDWVVIYDFIFDRLRAIRQDTAIQRIDAHTNIQLLEQIVRFLVYSSQRLCERPLVEFNAKINDQHIGECIRSLIALYDTQTMTDSDELNSSLGILAKCMGELSLNADRQQMEALYILLNIGDTEVLKRAIRLPLNLRRSMEVHLALEISFAWYLRNYVRVCSLIPRLHPILICAAMTNIQKLRRTALKVMSLGYNSKVLTFPGLKLQQLLLYNDIDKVRADCELFGLTFTEQNILFQKTNFNDNVELAHPEMYYSQRCLHSFLPRILLDA
ncbi:SAC3 domain-containing protein 1 [Ceratina calcarata]|uniref:SAC3 domain-containing protein 1 n=1 Tax=Ceratina calcarata TaxID=156304 RepID=A0AAJ7IWH9_9HYME|nr:SAC3 domain-containing protein 1 [Ceratina calcarata]